MPAAADSPDRSTPHAWLDVVDAAGATRRVALTASPALVGRTVEAEVCLDHPKVSRRHAELHRTADGGWTIHDLGSANGLTVNGLRCTAHALADGDVVQVGTFTLTFRAAGAPRRPLPADMGGQTFLLSDAEPGSIRVLHDFAPPRLDAGHMSALMAFGQALLAAETPAQRRTALCDLLVQEAFRGQWAQVLRLDRGQPDAVPAEVCPPRTAPTYRQQMTYLSQRLLRTVLERGQPALASNLASDAAAVEMTLSPAVAAISAVACPLRTEPEPAEPAGGLAVPPTATSAGSSPAGVDVLYAIFPPACGTVEWLMLVTLAVEQYRQADAAWRGRQHAQAHAALQRELDMATRIQQQLLPRRLDVPGLQVAIGFAPSRGVAGDYVDVVPTRDGRWLLTVADVCGKGLQAALVAASLHSMVHTAMRTGTSLAEMMAALNEYLCESLGGASFVTMIALLLDPASGRTQCANAGHPPAVAIAPDGTLRPCAASHGMPLGVDPEPPPVHDDVLPAGQVLALYSDGLPELHNASRQMLGTDRLHAELGRMVARAGPGPLAPLAQQLDTFLTRFAGGASGEDDRTFLLARRPLAAG